MDEPAGYGRQGLVAGDMAASQLTLEWRELTGARHDCTTTLAMPGLLVGGCQRACGAMVPQANVHCGLTGLLGIAGVPET